MLSELPAFEVPKPHLEAPISPLDQLLFPNGMANEWSHHYSQSGLPSRPFFKHHSDSADSNATTIHRKEQENGHRTAEQPVEVSGSSGEDIIRGEDDEATPLAEAAVVVEDIPSAPINVPMRSRGERYDSQAMSSASGSTDYSLSSGQSSLTGRKTSIGFGTKVRLSNNHETNLKGPPPKLSVRTRPRGKSLLDMMAEGRQHPNGRSAADSSTHDHDPVIRPNDSQSSAQHPHCSRSLPEWSDEFQSRNLHGDYEQNGLSTSRSTLSTHAEEQVLPATGHIASPLSASSPARDWFGSASQELPRRISTRSRSYVVDRPGGFSNRPSRRSTAASSASPASAFLAKYLPSSPLPAPDDEGQEVGDYVLGRTIGSGGFSVIREAFSLSGSRRVASAVKIVRRNVTAAEESENEIIQAKFWHEVEIWRSLSHPHILPLIAVYNTDFATFAFMRLNTGGTLHDVVKNNRSGFEPRLIRLYAAQLAAALRYLHEDARLVHRDVKLENCLVDMTAPDAAKTGGKLLLCDFGLADYYVSDNGIPALPSQNAQHSPFSPHKAATFPPITKPSLSQSQTKSPSLNSNTSLDIAGTLDYAAPEMLEGHTNNPSTHVDIWAFGIICFALTVGDLPFGRHDLPSKLRTKIVGGEWDKEALRIKEGYSNGGLSRGSAEGDDYFEKRRDASEQEDLPALSGVSELVEGCLILDPALRWDVQDLIYSPWLREEYEKIEDIN